MTNSFHPSAAGLAAELSAVLAPALAEALHKEMLATAAAAVRLYAESHPRPLHVTKTDAAEMLGISRPTVDNLIRAGTLSMNRCGKIPVSQIDAALAVAERGRRAARGNAA